MKPRPPARDCHTVTGPLPEPRITISLPARSKQTLDAMLLVAQEAHAKIEAFAAATAAALDVDLKEYVLVVDKGFFQKREAPVVEPAVAPRD